MRLIDADAFKQYCSEGLEEMKHLFKTDKGLELAIKTTESFLKDIDEQPTVEAQPSDAVDKRSLDSVINTLQTWIRTADDEYDDKYGREEYWRVQGLWEALQEIKKIKTFESSTNLVDRDAVINLINHSLCDLKRDADKQIFINTINSLPYVIPQQPSEDCISREEAINVICACYWGGKEGVENADLYDGYANAIEDAVEGIENLPSVALARKKGKWIEAGRQGGKLISRKCSECGWLIRPNTDNMNYCPNCGSYNGGGENEQDTVGD